jgi:hypothetical protein
VLRRYLQHFAGQASAQVVLNTMSSEPVAAAWRRLAATFSTGEPAPKQRFSLTIKTGTTLAGLIESLDAHGDGRSIFAHLDPPQAGTLFLGAFPCGGSMASLQVYLYGQNAKQAADALRTPLSAWLTGLFPTPAAT